MTIDWQAMLLELKPDVDELLADRKQFSVEFQELVDRELPRSALLDESLLRLRGLAFEAGQRQQDSSDPFEHFLQLTIVDAMDAAADAIAALRCGVGPPAIAVLRRQYELMIFLVAGWLDPSGLEREMRIALASPFPDDRYASAAMGGLLGAVMPKVAVIRNLGLGAGRDVQELDELIAIESGLASFGHGGLLAGASYLSGRSHAEAMLDLASGFDAVMTQTTAVSAAAASQIGARLGYQLVYGDADSVYGVDAVSIREDRAVHAFDKAFPLALEILWTALLGLNSTSFSFNTSIGSRPHDAVRRQAQVMTDGLETAWLATEYLFRGRLNGAATIIRRVFELSLEAQGWLRSPKAMERRFNSESRSKGPDRTAPAATTMIRWFHGAKSSVLQRATYSTLCSSAHGGIQAHEYLVDQTPGRVAVCPAPHFALRHQSWLLGTLVSGVDALLGAAILIAGREEDDIFRQHWGYHDFFRIAQTSIPGLTLVGHRDLDEIDTPKDAP